MATTLIVSDNTGGAQVLSRWVVHNLNPGECDFLLSGPSLSIFPEVIEGIQPLSELDAELSGYEKVFTSTSGADCDLEREVIKLAKEKGLPVISMLDHWSNYETRFKLGEEVHYPDKVWVTDSYAKAKAESIDGFPDVELVENHYLREQVEEIKTLTEDMENCEYLVLAKHRLLYVSEPSIGYNYSEYEALAKFFDYIENSGQFELEDTLVHIRLHPREDRDKYDELIADAVNKFDVQITEDTTLVEDCAWAQWVVGCQTMAMVIALEAGKKVASSMPPGEEVILPHKEIIRLFK